MERRVICRIQITNKRGICVYPRGRHVIFKIPHFMYEEEVAFYGGFCSETQAALCTLLHIGVLFMYEDVLAKLSALVG